MEKFSIRSVRPLCSWSGFLGEALLVGLLALGASAEDKLPPLHQLSDVELVADYEAAGIALTGTSMMPGAAESSRMERGNAFYARLSAARTELLRRGRECVPELNAFLEQEAPKQRNPTNPKENLSFTGDVLEILARIGDARSAQIALKILSGWEGQVDRGARYAASRALMRLTYVSFEKVRPSEFDYGEYVEHRDADAFSASLLPDPVKQELVAALLKPQVYDFNTLLKAVDESLKLKNATIGGEDMLRLRVYEKLQNLVSRGMVEQNLKQYRGLEKLKDALTPVDSLDESALHYQEWLEGEGKDPAQWLPMAVRRAHELLASENLDQVYCASSFLRPEKARDNQPELTMSRLADVVGKMELQKDGVSYFINGKAVPAAGGNWIKLLTDYGPQARKFSKLLIEVQTKQAVNQWSFYAYLRKVGGLEIMAFFFERLLIVSAEVEKITKDPATPKGFRSDDPRLLWLSSQREIQYGIHRWAGRIFATDAERLAWWKANQGRTPEQWLSDNLETIAEQADNNILWAASISRRILPDLPIGANDVDLPQSFIRPPDLKRIEGPFRTVWLRENRTKLRYDGNAGCFRLKH